MLRGLTLQHPRDISRRNGDLGGSRSTLCTCDLERSLGQGVTEFKKGLEGIPEDESKKPEPQKLDDQTVKS